MRARHDVVQVLLSPRIGGAETLAATLEAEFTALGLRTCTMYLDPPSGPRSRLVRVLRLFVALRRRRPAAVLAHSALPNIYARLAAPRRSAVVAVMHGGDDFTNRLLRWAERVLRLRTTAVVTVNETQRTLYRRRFGRRVSVVRIPNAISPLMAPPDSARPAAAVAATVSRVVPQKQPEFWASVTAAAAVALPSLRFDWWGPLGDEPAVAAAQQAVASSANAAFRGPTGDPVAAYAAADVLFHPSGAEAQSIGLLEAAACGLPIVCSEAVGATLDERVPRETFADGDVAGAVAALQRTLQGWPHAAQRAHGVAQTIRTDYSARACALRYLAVLGVEARHG